LLFIAALFLIIARFLSVFSGTPFPVDLVTSDSMTPTLMEGDIVAWTPTEIEEIEIGDIIVFKSYVTWPGEKLVVHRVSDIRTSPKGTILLETKGDKNDWTDQKGPHIPEPYIREDHVMGKIVSIGSVPLKVPFIGQFGIWINEGLNTISQPASSKESINYIGIFAPLTISAVILVILVFIVPEKAETIKEKLHQSILGKKPLNLKKTMITLLITYILFFTVIHAFAYESMNASVGINTNCPDSNIEFGRIKENKKSFYRDFPVINPSAMPVKGIIFAKGNIGDYITKKTFELDRAEERTLKLQAFAPNGSKNGSYMGDIMMYSSPFWLMIPNPIIETLYNWNAEATVFTLDFLSGLILTFLTFVLLISITLINDKTRELIIDRSWQHPSRIILGEKIIKKLKSFKTKAKQKIKKNIIWILKIDIADKKEKMFSSVKKPAIASLIIIPIIYIMEEKLAAMILSVILAGIIAYFISCKIRKKIVITVLITASFTIAYMMINSNIIILGKEANIIEILSLSLGIIGLYMLIFTFLLIPLTFVVWKIASIIRNVKEEKEPLLSLEGRCDL